MGIASGAAALLFGVAWANFIRGVPMGPAHIVHASLFSLLNPYALLGGLTTLTLFLTHGANFLALRTTYDVRGRARATARRVAPVAAVLMIAFLVWTVVNQSFGIGVLIPAIVAGLLVTAVPIVQSRSDGEAFMIGAGAVLLLVVVYCAALYPNALPSSTNHAFDLTLASAASGHYTLTVMTVVAIMFVPVVLGYTAWSYWVFRHRLGRSDFDGTPTPLAALDQRFPRKNGKPELPIPPAKTDAPVPS
jgi:cytochrome d ubiquinol oxidase subunit II